MKKLGIILSLLVIFSGCASTSIKSTAIKTNSTLKPEQGVVVVEVINNTERLAPLHKDWTEVIAIRLDNADEKKQAAIEKAKKKKKSVNVDKVKWEHDFFSLTPSREGVVNSQVFIGAMPEGEYIITTLYSFYSDGNMSSWVSMPVYHSAGKFNVKKKRLTSLGSLVFQPLLSIKEKSFWNNRSSQKAYVTRLKEQEPLAQYVLGNYPQLSKQIEVNEPLTWKEDSQDAYRNKLGVLSRENAYGNIAISLSENAKGAIASKFGQLNVLNQDNSWKQVDLPTNSEIHTVLEIDDTFFVGSEKGSLFSKSLNSETVWKRTSPISPKEAIVWLAKGDSQYYGVTQSNLNYKAYSFTHPNSDWKEIGRFKKTNRTWLVQYGGLFPIITSEGHLRIFNDNKIHDFIVEKGTWKASKGQSLRKVAQLRDKTLVGVEVSQWDGVGDQVVSIDNGKTWVDINRKLKTFGDQKTDLSLPAKLDEDLYVSLGRESIKGKKKSTLKIMSNNYDGLSTRNTWKYHQPAKAKCETLLAEISNHQKLYFLCDQGQLVSTSDFGKTWVTEIDIDLAAMQTEYENLIEAIKASEEKKNLSE